MEVCIKIKGFTLAEILITLAIIGVVATLTIPGTIKNYRNKVLMTQLQNTINLVKTAVANSMDDNVAENFGDIVSTGVSIENFFEKYFDTVNICSDTTGFDGCLVSTYTSFDKSKSRTSTEILNSYMGSANYRACVVLTSGATVCVGTWSGYTPPVLFLIDQNGLESPNVAGKDLFRLQINQKGGKIEYGYSISTLQSANMCVASSLDAWYCLPMIISKGWQFMF